nr:tetratricopeptide repeat protein [Candidatus Sigynarchaeota archaeon]
MGKKTPTKHGIEGPTGEATKTATELLHEGATALSRDDVFEALRCFRQATKVEPMNVLAWFELGQLLERMGDNPPGIMAREDLWKEALQSYGIVTTLNPRHAKAWAFMGCTYLSLSERAYDVKTMENYSQLAVIAFSKSIDIDGGDAPAWFERGMTFLRLKRTEEARDGFARATEIDPKHARAWWNLALLEEAGGNLQTALTAFQNFLRLEPSNREAETRVIQMRIRLEVARSKPDTEGNAKALSDLDIGDKLLKDSNFPKALQFLNKAHDFFKENDNLEGQIESLRNTAAAHKGLHQWTACIESLKALREVSKVAKDLSKEAEASLNLGYARMKAGQNRPAIEDFLASTALNRQLGDKTRLADGLSNLGMAYRNCKEYDKAIETFTEALLIDKELKNLKNEASDLTEMAATCAEMGDLLKAIVHYDAAIQVYATLKYSFKIEDLKKTIKEIKKKLKDTQATKHP